MQVTLFYAFIMFITLNTEQRWFDNYSNIHAVVSSLYLRFLHGLDKKVWIDSLSVIKYQSVCLCDVIYNFLQLTIIMFSQSNPDVFW